jgi:hypothetical protein
MNKAACFLTVLLVAAPGLTNGAFAQVDCNKGLEPIARDADTRMSPTEFIRDVAANELAFGKAFANFNYGLAIELKTLSDGGDVDGEYRQVMQIAHDGASGVRRITTVGDIVNTLKRVSPPNRDVDALREAFVITPAVLADRDVVYSGRQKVADFNAAVFDILPRNSQSASRAFSGRTWVRLRDNAVARMCGRVIGGPFGPMRYLVQRSKVADKYWFPMTIEADEKVRSGDNDVHLRVEVTYTDYVSR